MTTFAKIEDFWSRYFSEAVIVALKPCSPLMFYACITQNMQDSGCSQSLRRYKFTDLNIIIIIVKSQTTINVEF